MARHRNANWTLSGSDSPLDEREPQSWEQVSIAVLMDIREELQRLNSLLHCHNFLEFPRVLRQIRRNTTKKKKAR